MGWLADGVEEFRKLPPAGKVAVGAVGLGVVALAIAQARSSAANAANASTSSTGSTSAPVDTTGLNTPVVSMPGFSSSPTDWANWFNSGLTLPAVPPLTSPVSAPPAGTSTAPAATATASAPVAAAVAEIHSASTAPVAHPAPTAPKSAPAPALPPIQNPTAAQTAAHRGTPNQRRSTFIPTTIRPRPTPGRGRAI